MTPLSQVSYLRYHRKQSGLNQQELAGILGLTSEIQVSRHERGTALPPILAAMSYEIVFQMPISGLFPGLYGAVWQNVECRIETLEHELQQHTAKGREATFIARKLEWMWERRNAGSALFPYGKQYR